MGKKIKKWLCVVLAVILLTSVLPLIAGAIAPSTGGSVQGAPSSGQLPLKVEIQADKDKYTLLGKMEFTATITNTSSETVSDISAVALFGASLRPLKGSTLTANKTSLAPNESFSFTYYADLKGLKGLDNLLLPLFWVSSLFHGGKMDAPIVNDGTGYIEGNKTVGLLSLFNGQYDVSTSVRVFIGEISVKINSSDTIDEIESKEKEIKSLAGGNLEKACELLYNFLLQLQTEGKISDLKVDKQNPYFFSYRYIDSEFADGYLGGWFVKYPYEGNGEQFGGIQPREKIVLQNTLPQQAYLKDNGDVLILSSFSSSVLEDVNYWAAGELLKNKLVTDGDYNVALKYNATVADYMNMSSYGIIIVYTHGVVYNESPAIQLEEKNTWTKRIKYKELLDNEEILSSNGRFYILSKFFQTCYSTNKLSNPLIHLAMCFSYWNDNLVNVLVSIGAKSILAYTDSVQVVYDRNIVLSVFDEMLKGKTVEESRKIAVKEYGESDNDSEIGRASCRERV